MSSHVYHLILLYMKIRFRERKSVARVKYFDYTDVAKPLFCVGNIAGDISGIIKVPIRLCVPGYRPMNIA